MERLPREFHDLAWTILQYLNQNVDACDTVEGIRNWWLAPESGVWSKEEIFEVLELLVEHQLLTARGAGIETRVYALDKARIDAVRRFLRNPGQGL